MSNERLIIGVPGSGKTSTLSVKCADAVKKYGNDRVLVCSLTKAAANEIGSRETGVDPDMTGTLHSFCFNLLDKPEIIETEKNIKEWNSEYPMYRVTPSEAGNQEASNLGDRLLQEVNILRAMCKPIDEASTQAKHFYEKWQDFKTQTGMMDFADLIEVATQESVFPPNDAKAIMVDEAQDLSRAEYRLLERWARVTDEFTLVGDRAQSLFMWRGSDPDVMDINRMNKEHVRILSQSYRVPRAVRDYAMKVLKNNISGSEADIEYEPVDRPGSVDTHEASLRNLEALLPDLETWIKEEKSVMLLASTGYMVRKITGWLRSHGLPFHNPYTDRWNPLSSDADTCIAQLSAFMVLKNEDRFWAPEEFRLATQNLMKVFKRGFKKKIKAIDPFETTPEEIALMVSEMFKDEADKEAFLSCDMKWWLRKHKSRKSEAMKYAVSIYESGQEWKRPQVIPGTYHSVKGGEADVVVLFPDLSVNGFIQMCEPGIYGRESIARMIYVGITRSKDKVLLCSPSKKRYWQW